MLFGLLCSSSFTFYYLGILQHLQFPLSLTGKADGATHLPEGEKRQDLEPTQDDERRECKAVSNLTIEEEVKNLRVQYASSQAANRKLTNELNGSNCKLELLQLELDTERQRNQRPNRRMKDLGKEMKRDRALIPVLSDCKTKVEQLERLEQSSQELKFKFQESRETALHVRERIGQLELQQAIKEERIKELMDQLSQYMKIIETQNEVEKHQEELQNQGLSRLSEQMVHAENESPHYQGKNVSHSSPPFTNTSKICIIL